MCFTADAMDCYIELTIVSYWSNLIPLEICIDRLQYLVDGKQEQLETGERRYYCGAEEALPVEQHRKVEANSLGGTPSPVPLAFMLSPQSRLHDWVFTVGDPDPLPSIPHGHWQTQSSPKKFDAYRGYIVINGNSAGRLTRNEVAEFWNDGKFREFARNALGNLCAGA
jgi:hypothetical protein